MSAAQIAASIQAGLPAANYSSSTTSSQAKADLRAVLSNVIAMAHRAVLPLPVLGVTAHTIEAVVPQNAALAESIVRAISALKVNLSSPLSPEEAYEILSIFKDIQVQLVVGLIAYAVKAPAINAAVPGLSSLANKTRKSIVNSLVDATIEVLPSNAQNTVKEIKDKIDAALELVA